MSENVRHCGEITDSAAAPRGTWCDLLHHAPDRANLVLLVNVAASLRLFLTTTTGARYVDLCDDIDHDDLTAAELVEFSHAIDPAQTQLEAEIDAVEMDWGLSAERMRRLTRG